MERKCMSRLRCWLLRVLAGGRPVVMNVKFTGTEEQGLVIQANGGFFCLFKG